MTTFAEASREVQFSLATETRGDTIVVRVTGECDLYGAPEFTSALDAALDETARTVEVDFDAATFVDSTALAVLLRAHARARTRDRRLVLVGLSRDTRRAFEITGLDRTLTIA
jgi:anti-sigma B factor antagonist